MDLEIEYLGDKDFMKRIEKYFNMKNIGVSNVRFIQVTDDELGEAAATNEGHVCTKSVYTVDVPKYINSTKVIQDLCRKKRCCSGESYNRRRIVFFEMSCIFKGFKINT